MDRGCKTTKHNLPQYPDVDECVPCIFIMVSLRWCMIFFLYIVSFLQLRHHIHTLHMNVRAHKHNTNITQHYGSICFQHFCYGMIILIVLPGKPANEMYNSHPDWAPSLNLGHTEMKATKTARYDRQEMRKRQRTDSTPAMDETVIDDLVPPGKPYRASRYKTLYSFCCCCSWMWQIYLNKFLI